MYHDEMSRQREKKRRYRKNKKPYYAKRADIRQALEDRAAITQKTLEGVYAVVVVDPPWPVAFQARVHDTRAVSGGALAWAGWSEQGRIRERREAERSQEDRPHLHEATQRLVDVVPRRTRHILGLIS